LTFQYQETDWFLAQVKPNCVNIANINLTRQGFQTFIPRVEETRKRNGKFVNTIMPLFPGYIFVTFNIANSLWRTINSTHGITRLVSFGNIPATLPKDLVSDLMQRCDTNAKLLPSGTLRNGDRVTLTKGPFANFVGKVENITPERRVWVLIELMGRKIRVVIEKDILQTINE